MTDFLPLFPLKLVVFPNEELNLHIFEPRYKQLVRECEHNGITFGIPTHLDNKVMDFGTEVELLKILKKNPDGSIDIKTKGVGIFKIHDFFATALNKMYAGADIERIEGSMESDENLTHLILERAEELYDYLEIKRKLPTDVEHFTTYSIAHHVGFSIEQEYHLLTLTTEKQRQQFMYDHLLNLLPIVKEMEKLRKKAQMNGHFKNVIPPK